MESMEYYVVLFEEFVSVAPSTWINKDDNILYWPKSTVTHKKMNAMVPDKTWFRYNIKQCLGPYESLEKAIEMEERGQFLSTSSDTDTLLTSSSVVKKRTKYKKERCASESSLSDSEDSTANWDKAPNSLPASTLYKRSFAPQATNLKNIAGTKSILNPCKTKCPEVDVKKNYKVKTCNADGNINICSNDQILLPAINTSTINNDQIKKPNNFNIEHVNNYVEAIPALESTSEFLPEISLLDYNINNAHVIPLQTITNAQNEQLLTEARYKVYHEQILRKLNRLEKFQRFKDSERENEESEILPQFPLQSKDDVEELENLLKQSEQAKDAYRKEIKHLGGKGIAKIVNRAFYYIMTNELAVQYSWSGARNTDKFKDKLVCKILLDAITKKYNFELNKCEQQGMIWVQHAKDRVKKNLPKEADHN